MADVSVQTGFAVSFAVDLGDAASDETLYETGPLRLALRMAGTDPALAAYDRYAGNYLAFPLADGSCPVVEATLAGLRAGIPLGLLERADGVHGVEVRVAGSHFSVSVDGLVDDDLFSVPSVGIDLSAPAVRSPRVARAEVSVPAPPDAAARVPDSRPVRRSVQYWTPDGHDAWVGDVVLGRFAGRLHVFYLFDRRHHGSKGGAGGHWFAHLSSADLVRWEEHPPAVPVEEWWETVGTGTPFAADGRLCLAYGLHTERISDDPSLPAGATWAVSDDGVHFRKSGRIFHPTRNPAVYARPGGGLGLAAGYAGESGLWTGSPDAGWTLRDATLPTRGDCPCPFEWNGHFYVFQGFGGFAHSATGEPGSWEDWAAAGLAPYDGLSVPSVAPFGEDRRILAGWLGFLDEAWWGGWLVFRELLRFPDGTLGTKWVPEIAPPSPPETFAAPSGRPLRVAFPRDGADGPALVFSFDPAARTASFADDVPEPRFGALHSAGNVRIGRIPRFAPGASVRIVRHWDPKAGATVFDAEIGGVRTLVCRRAGRYRGASS